MKILKYPLLETSYQIIKMPSCAKPMYVRAIEGKAFIWVEADDTRPVVSHGFGVVCTGQEMLPGVAGVYIGTFFIPEQAFVGHAYYYGEEHP